MESLAGKGKTKKFTTKPVPEHRACKCKARDLDEFCKLIHFIYLEIFNEIDYFSDFTVKYYLFSVDREMKRLKEKAEEIPKLRTSKRQEERRERQRERGMFEKVVEVEVHADPDYVPGNLIHFQMI